MRRLFLRLAIAGLAISTPSWLLAGDNEIAQQIAANLHDSGKMHGYRIGVKVKESTVFINGTVKSQEQLATALDIVQNTPGIDKIVNGVSVAADPSAPAVRAVPTVQAAPATQAVSIEPPSTLRAQLALNTQPDFETPARATPAQAQSSVVAASHAYAAPGRLPRLNRRRASPAA